MKVGHCSVGCFGGKCFRILFCCCWFHLLCPGRRYCCLALLRRQPPSWCSGSMEEARHSQVSLQVQLPLITAAVSIVSGNGCHHLVGIPVPALWLNCNNQVSSLHLQCIVGWFHLSVWYFHLPARRPHLSIRCVCCCRHPLRRNWPPERGRSAPVTRLGFRQRAALGVLLLVRRSMFSGPMGHLP